MTLDRLYQSRILELNRSPLHRGELEGATHEARGTDALCGDDILVRLVVEGSRIEACAWTGEACAITTASASMLAEWITGRTVGTLRAAHARFRALLADDGLPDDEELGEINLLRAVADYPSRVRNALLPWETVDRALESI